MLQTKDLFATPIWTLQLSEQFNDGLKEEIHNMMNLPAYGTMNIFDNLYGKHIQELKQHIQSAYYDISTKHDMAHYTPKVGGRINVLKYGEADTPHDHVAKALVVGVYYLEVYPNCGDLLLHDPRGGVAWKNLNFEPDDPLPRTSRTYHRFKPQEGMMILFPSYLVHSVETNLTDKNRISLVLHI